jgi:hypothetical protein
MQACMPVYIPAMLYDMTTAIPTPTPWQSNIIQILRCGNVKSGSLNGINQCLRSKNGMLLVITLVSTDLHYMYEPIVVAGRKNIIKWCEGWGQRAGKGRAEGGQRVDRGLERLSIDRQTDMYQC